MSGGDKTQRYGSQETVTQKGPEMERLFEPLSINSLTLKNRILMPCLDPGFAGEGGVVNSRLTEYFTKRAKGGVAFIMVGPFLVVGNRLWVDIGLVF